MMKTGASWCLVLVTAMIFIVTACEQRAPVVNPESDAVSAASDSDNENLMQGDESLTQGDESAPSATVLDSYAGGREREIERTKYGPVESSLVLEGGGLQGRVENVLRSEKFDDFLTAVERENANNLDARSRQAVYREALEQTLSEIPGASAPIRFTCGSIVCAGYLSSEAGSDWFSGWQTDLMKDQLAPISTMAVKNVDLPDGTIQHRFLFTTSGPGRVRMRRGQ